MDTGRKLEPTNHSAHVRGIRLRYVDWGDSGPPLLMLHGDMRTSRSWDAVAKDLYSQFHAFALDARGHGDSEWPPTGYRFNDRVEDLAAFCRHLGLRDVVGVGHSTGGVVMTLLADRDPGTFGRLVLLEPMVVVDERFHRMVSARAEQPRRTWASREELREYLRHHQTARRWRDDVIRDVVEHEAMELPDGRIGMKWAGATMSWKERQGDHVDLTPLLRRLSVPVLFVVSQERGHAFEGLKPLATEVPDFHMVTIRGTGHNMYMERPDAVALAIQAFAEGRELPTTI